jgi:peroxiredoxin
MKRIFGILLSSVALFSCKLSNHESKAGSGDSTFTITGKIEGIDTAKLVLFKIWNDSSKVDSAITDKSGNFTFKGIAKEPMMAMMIMAQSAGVMGRPLQFFIEPGTTTITAKHTDFANATVKGGSSNDDFNELTKWLRSFEDKAKALNTDAQKAYQQHDSIAMMGLQQRYQEIQKAQNDTLSSFIKQHPNRYTSAFYLYQLSLSNPTDKIIADGYAKFNDNIKQSFYAKKIKAVIDIAQKTDVGGQAPEFALNTPDNKTVALSSLKGKYVLLDFWASWCGPCRQENPNVVAAFNKYKNKNFTILSVSLDNDKAKWQQAIAQDKLAWTHVSDLKGWESGVAGTYGIQAIPANFLLDPGGKIIAKNLRGADLDNKLAEVLK